MNKITKTLTTCTPREFLAQSVKIKKAAENWITKTDVINILNRQPEILPLGDDKEEAKKILRRNIKARETQMQKNLWAAYETCALEYPDETLEVLALACFIEPKKIDSYDTSEIMRGLAGMIGDEGLISFFTSLAQWGQTNTLPR